jgi:hypothetical protein
MSPRPFAGELANHNLVRLEGFEPEDGRLVVTLNSHQNIPIAPIKHALTEHLFSQ